jgi:hypothetical protein
VLDPTVKVSRSDNRCAMDLEPMVPRSNGVTGLMKRRRGFASNAWCPTGDVSKGADSCHSCTSLKNQSDPGCSFSAVHK